MCVPPEPRSRRSFLHGCQPTSRVTCPPGSSRPLGRPSAVSSTSSRQLSIMWPRNRPQLSGQMCRNGARRTVCALQIGGAHASAVGCRQRGRGKAPGDRLRSVPPSFESTKESTHRDDAAALADMENAGGIGGPTGTCAGTDPTPWSRVQWRDDRPRRAATEARAAVKTMVARDIEKPG